MPIAEIPHLLELAQRAARGKRRSPAVAAFMLDPFPKLALLAEELNDQTYTPGQARCFWVKEPKRRLIAALPFRDRIVQHLLIEASMPALERWFAPQSYACRVGKGSHRALRRAVELHRNFDWVLRLDIAKFFPSIDHQVARKIIMPRTPVALRWLVDRIVDNSAPCEHVAFHFPGDDLLSPLMRPHGLPIGNLTSQVWANAVLTPVDHLLASGLGIGTFVRYCDDILVYGNSRDALANAWTRVLDFSEGLRLRLHPTKCRLHRTSESVTFVGFVLSKKFGRTRVWLRTENLRRFRRRMLLIVPRFLSGEVEAQDLTARVRAWIAHTRHGHSARIRRTVLLANRLLA